MENLYANVPRDLTRVKSKVFLNLTRRQLICFGAAAAIGVPLFFLIKKSGNVTLASLAMIVVMMPFFFLALYERNGRPMEVLIRHYIDARFKRPKVRQYRTDNVYSAAERAAHTRKEVARIVSESKGKKGTGKAGKGAGAKAVAGKDAGRAHKKGAAGNRGRRAPRKKK